MQKLKVIFIKERAGGPDEGKPALALSSRNTPPSTTPFKVMAGLALLGWLLLPDRPAQARPPVAEPSQSAPVNCNPVPVEAGVVDHGFSLNPGDWIGWALGDIARQWTAFFYTLANSVLQWGQGCNTAGVNFVSQTPYIQPTGNFGTPGMEEWVSFMGWGAVAWAILLLQVVWAGLEISMGLSLPAESARRLLLGMALSTLGGGVLDLTLRLANAFSGLIGQELYLLEPSFQLDRDGNVLYIAMSLVLCFAAMLLIFQMAMRLVYLYLVAFLFPLAGALWPHPSTRFYARLLYQGWLVTLAIQPVQLAALRVAGEIYSSLRGRSDLGLATLFGIGGVFLALGIPRLLNQSLGQSTPLGFRGLVLGTMLLGRKGAGLFKSSESRGSPGGGSGTTGRQGQPGPASPGGSPPGRGMTGGLPGGGSPGTGTSTSPAPPGSLRYAGDGQGPVRNTPAPVPSPPPVNPAAGTPSPASPPPDPPVSGPPLVSLNEIRPRPSLDGPPRGGSTGDPGKEGDDVAR